VSATVRQMLAGRGSIISVAPSTTVFEALQRMAEHNIGAVLVMSDRRLVGIFSERDYARKVVLRGLNSRNTPVGDLMTGKVITVELSWTADQCMALMTEHHIRHLPVVEGDDVVGVISIGDAVKAVVDEQHFVIGQLTNYITQT
jgi:CBS domain-containing protein